MITEFIKEKRKRERKFLQRLSGPKKVSDGFTFHLMITRKITSVVNYGLLPFTSVIVRENWKVLPLWGTGGRISWSAEEYELRKTGARNIHYTRDVNYSFPLSEWSLHWSKWKRHKFSRYFRKWGTAQNVAEKKDRECIWCSRISDGSIEIGVSLRRSGR